MPNVDPSNPPSGSHSHHGAVGGAVPPFDPAKGSGGYYEPGSGWKGFRDWMGDANYKKFTDSLCKEISNEIKKQREKSHKAALRLKAAEEGNDDYTD